jgi:hypothetical protein
MASREDNYRKKETMALRRLVAVPAKSARKNKKKGEKINCAGRRTYLERF